MTSETTDLNTGFKVPNAYGAVIGAGDEDGKGWVLECFTELETQDTICVTSQCADETSTTAPVTLDGKALTVDVFPGTGHHIWTCVCRRGKEVGGLGT